MVGVGAKARALAMACGLPEGLGQTLDEAGRLHDLGKNDPRFQLMLGAYGGPLLAKSGSHEVAVSRKLAGLPRGWRHELASVAQRIDIDPLVRYLIGAHHGRGRPWMPASADPKLWHKAQAGQWPALAAEMQGRFGYWGLCYLEAILRLADWARSAEEQDAAQLLEGEHAAA
jgi:CRISPR-associated endonuclease/helicase Cas3